MADVALGTFDRDTAVLLEHADGAERVYGAEVSSEWMAGRGPHGGYLAAMLLRAMTDALSDAERHPRSLTIHYVRSPDPGPVRIRTTLEREGRSLSTMSARMESESGSLLALVLGAFSVPWDSPELSELPMPDVAPPDTLQEPDTPLMKMRPVFTQHLNVQHRIGAIPFQGSTEPMRVGAWMGLAEPRAVDALSLALLSDAMFPPPFIQLREPKVSPTIDLTIHFRTPVPRDGDSDPAALCFGVFDARFVSEGFFVEDGTIWAPDGTVLVQSRQLALLLAPPRQ